MFTRFCGAMYPHERHDYAHTWHRQETEPEGWFPPGTYVFMPNRWIVNYRCRGLAELD